MNFTEMDEAIKEAESTIKRAEYYRERMLRFLLGRLRTLSPHQLKQLKKELTQFNASTGEWKN